MSTLKKITKILPICFLVGCASIADNKMQAVSVSTGEVTGAMCTLTNTKGSFYVQSTPGTVTIQQACDPLAIMCNKKGYKASAGASGAVQDQTKGMAWGNIIFGGIIGIAVDRSSGAACRYPANIMYPMEKDNKAKQESADLTSELKKLNDLYKSGGLTKQEYDQAKAMILK